MVKFLKEHGSEIARTVALSVLGAIGIILSPVRDRLQDWFRSEQASIAIQVPESVSVGHAVGISFIMIPRTTSGVSGGVLSFDVEPSGNLQFLDSGATKLQVSQFKDVTTLPPKPLMFKVTRQGDLTIKAVFTNRKSQTNEVYKVISVRPIGSSGPSDLDYTGTWDVSLRFHGKVYHGELCMEDKSGYLSGGYALVNGGERGTISGKHDGRSLWALLHPSGAAKGWYLEGGGAVPTEDRFLRIKGYTSACSNEPCPGAWKEKQCSGDCFELSSSLLAASPTCQH